jgi:ParB/RepB/Spo0J family partition protein
VELNSVEIKSEEYLGHVISINASDIREFAEQPRTYFNKKTMNLLIANIDLLGQRDPVWVIKLPEGDTHQYVLVDGARRKRACEALGIPVQALIRTNITDIREQYIVSLLAKGDEPLTELENINAVKKVRDWFGLNNK